MTEQNATPGQVTIFDVARHAGVSYSTVSRVVNNYKYVKPATRAKVQAAMEELGYVANIKARSLAGGRSQLIGVLAYDLNTSYSVEIVRGIDAEVSLLDYDMMLSTTHQRKVKEATYVAKLARGLVDGLLVILPRNLEAYVDDLRRQDFPFVLIDHEGLDETNTTVRATNWQGGYDATAHLAALGHRRIGIIAGPLDLDCARDRLAGYKAALQEHSVAFDPQLVFEGDFLEPSGRAAGNHFLALSDRPTAVFSCSDLMALSLIQCAAENGLAVPGDLSVIGFDDIPEVAWSRPGLTTVRQPLMRMGRIAARVLIERIEDPQHQRQRIELPTRLVMRESTAPPTLA